MSGRKITTMSGRVVDVPNFKKRTSARKPWPPSGSVLASKVSRLEKQVKLQEGEWKYLDVTQASTASVSAGALTLLTGCATGDGPSNREGTQIYVKSIQVRARIEFNNGDASAELFVWCSFKTSNPTELLLTLAIFILSLFLVLLML